MSNRDRAFLHAHGVGIRPDQLEVAVVDALARRQPIMRGSSADELGASELGVLRSGGFEPEPQADDDPLARTVAEHAALIKTSLSVVEVARRLGVDASRVRQRLGERSLYGIRTGEGWIVPPFQLEGSRALPGLADVLRALDPELHPLEVERFFTEPDASLTQPRTERALSPREWLLAGFPSAPVARLADEL